MLLKSTIASDRRMRHPRVKKPQSKRLHASGYVFFSTNIITNVSLCTTLTKAGINDSLSRVGFQVGEVVAVNTPCY